MGDPDYYKPPAELVEMKEEIASRAFRIKLKGAVITGIFAVVGIALMASGMPLAGMLAGVGSAIAGLVTLKESKKLAIDEQFLESRMQGGNWWSGYRREVMGQGNPGPSAPVLGAPNPHNLGR